MQCSAGKQSVNDDSDLKIEHHRIGGKIGKARLNLSRFLFIGATKYNAIDAIKKIELLELGPPQSNRLIFLKAFKTEMLNRLNNGQSVESIKAFIDLLGPYVRFLETKNLSFDLKDLKRSYLEYCEFLIIESNIKKNELKATTVYGYACSLSSIFDSILDLHTNDRLFAYTRVKAYRKRIKKTFKDSQKQNLEVSFKQGHFLADLVRGLTLKAVKGPLPICIKPSDGVGKEIFLHATLKKFTPCVNTNLTPSKRFQLKAMLKKREPNEQVTGKGSSGRWQLINLRVQAELLLFLAQTGMNLSQAIDLKKTDFKFRADGEGWKVEEYKNRKSGEVSFKIYKEYKPFFHDFVAFTKSHFPDSEYFFPYFSNGGKFESPNRNGLRQFSIVKALCLKHLQSWTPPRTLRSTRVNWLLRRSGDEDLTAKIAQHGKKTLKQRYLIPNQQRAMVELTRFWNENDPLEAKELTTALIGSLCNGIPSEVENKPDQVTSPNCITPSGCFWCSHHRDIDSEDYVWSLTSMRQIKIIEASILITPSKAPVDFVIERITEKLEWFENSSATRKTWVIESQAKIREGDFHPNWNPIKRYLD